LFHEEQTNFAGEEQHAVPAMDEQGAAQVVEAALRVAQEAQAAAATPRELAADWMAAPPDTQETLPAFRFRMFDVVRFASAVVPRMLSLPAGPQRDWRAH
jgi:hypothetical protein